MTVAELREKVQSPRRPYDTLYGRFVMRRFSVYLTAGFAQTPFVTPSMVTLLSVFCGLLGAVCWYYSEWIQGALFLNLWYLLDHVDGELARLKGASSATGLYLDTIANALVIPASYAALGAGLGRPWLGAAAAYGALMLLVITYCESAVLLQWQGGRPAAAPAAPAVARKAGPFAWVHRAFSYPVFLPVATLASFAGALEPVLTAYAAGINLVWCVVLARTVLSRKMESKVSI